MSSWSTLVWDDWLKNGTPYHDNFGLSFWLWKSMNEQIRKFRQCGAKETLLSLILVIIASCLIFPINICEFFLAFLYEQLIEMRGDYVLLCKGDK